MTITEMRKVLKDFEDDKIIQSINKRYDSEWGDCKIPHWDFNGHDYRAKPEPREFWINVYTDGGHVEGVYPSREKAVNCRDFNGETIKVIEVLDE